MSIKIPIIALSLPVMIIAASFWGHAQAPQFVQDEASDLCREQQQKYEEILGSVKDVPPDQWTIKDTNLYFEHSLWVVYLGLNYYWKKNGSLPASVESLSGTEFVPTWPKNPYNNWEDIKVSTTSQEFKPGEFTLQICPPSFYSYPKNLRPVSFELAVFGPNKDYSGLGDAQPLKENTWAQTPEGALFMLGQFVETAETTRKKMEEMKAKMQSKEGNK